jgi:hypothetical protein
MVAPSVSTTTAPTAGATAPAMSASVNVRPSAISTSWCCRSPLSSLSAMATAVSKRLTPATRCGVKPAARTSATTWSESAAVPPSTYTSPPGLSTRSISARSRGSSPVCPVSSIGAPFT